jgi:hypothetical protein
MKRAMKLPRFAVLVAMLAAIAGWMLSHSTTIVAAENASKVQLNVSDAAPRQIEDATELAIARDYAKAWQAMEAARDQNRPDLLGAMFVGTAKDEIEQAIRDQQKSNVRVRYVDLGHKLRAVFYSQEGSAMQLRDTASVEIQLLDGNSVVHSEDANINYIVLMTPAADHWQVRMMQAVPKF